MSLTALSLSVLSDGQDVDLFAVSPEYTVSQAAEFLKMSERHLNNLLNAGYIAYRLENGERLIHLDSMLEYKQEIERRHAACDKLMLMFQEMGLSDD